MDNNTSERTLTVRDVLTDLLGVGVPAISKHLDNINESGELQREATVSILETVQQEGLSRSNARWMMAA